MRAGPAVRIRKCQAGDKRAEIAGHVHRSRDQPRPPPPISMHTDHDGRERHIGAEDRQAEPGHRHQRRLRSTHSRARPPPPAKIPPPREPSRRRPLARSINAIDQPARNPIAHRAAQKRQRRIDAGLDGVERIRLLQIRIQPRQAKEEREIAAKVLRRKQPHVRRRPACASRETARLALLAFGSTGWRASRM